MLSHVQYALTHTTHSALFLSLTSLFLIERVRLDINYTGMDNGPVCGKEQETVFHWAAITPVAALSIYIHIISDIKSS